MKKSATVATLFPVLFLAGCASPPGGVRDGRFEAPEKNLSLQETDLQRLVDKATDGSVVKIPLGRYRLSRPLKIAHRSDVHISFAPGTQVRGVDPHKAVVVIEHCRNVTLSGVRARHVNPLPDYHCHGPVVYVESSSGIRIENCELNGCGAIGVSANRSSLTIANCHIHHNTFNAFYFSKCEDVKVLGNIIENNANTFQAYRCGEMEFSDNLLRNNGGYWHEPHRPGIQKRDAQDD